MKTRDAVIGFIFLVVLIAGIIWIFRVRSNRTSNIPVPTPSIAGEVSKAFPNLTVPSGADRADLRNVSGGQGVGVATRQKNNGQYTYTVMANLTAPSTGFYEANISNGTNNVALGKMELTKSGYLVNFVSTQDLSGYNKVSVVNGATALLEGSF